MRGKIVAAVVLAVFVIAPPIVYVATHSHGGDVRASSSRYFRITEDCVGCLSCCFEEPEIFCCEDGLFFCNPNPCGTVSSKDVCLEVPAGDADCLARIKKAQDVCPVDAIKEVDSCE